MDRLERLFICGQRRLRGTVKCSGSKNAALAVVAAALSVAGKCEISNVPSTTDILVLVEILKSLGASVWLSPDATLTVDATHIESQRAPEHLVRMMRGSFYVAGALLGRFHRAEVALPGGCTIGARPVDYHMAGFRALGASVRLVHGMMKASTSRLRATRIYLDPRYCSVGATNNIMMAAVFARGTSVIENASRDPDVVACATFLNQAGAAIEGVGTSTLTINGVEGLNGTKFRVPGDRIEAGTFLMAGAITGGDVTVDDVSPGDMERVLATLDDMGMEIDTHDDKIRLRACRRPRPVETITAPHPGFPTDLQPPLVALAAIAEGKSILEEAIFEARLTYTGELLRMGADIRNVDASAVVTGVKRLSGARVKAPDLRAGAALIVAGLAAEGETAIEGLECVDRGYVDIESKLAALGATVARVDASQRARLRSA
jgi:UDP-N-acetylglucosamine 1-carboxyvinyltransferase